MLIDTHCHLDDAQYDNDREAAVSRAVSAGVGYMVNAGSEPKGNRAVAELSKRFEQVYSAVGIHPHHAAEAVEPDFAELKELASLDKVVAIGETGLDYFKNLSPAADQKKIFARQLELAKELALPVILHCRDAEDDCIGILRAADAQECGGVLHCFNGSIKIRDEALRLGFYIAVGGAVTFPKADALREAIKGIPLQRLLLETDCPYLAPQSVRGKRNEPANLREILEKVSLVTGISKDVVEKTTSVNAGYLFGVGIKEQGQITYQIRDQLYLNITNRCSNNCGFCVRNSTDFVKGHNLRLKKEPTAKQVIEAVKDPKAYSEVVFCGYGEPLIRLSAVKEISGWIKEKGGKVRINTNGQANLIHSRKVCGELKGLVDSVSVSLNAQDASVYDKICSSQYGLGAFAGLKDFILDAKGNIPEVSVTFVTVPGVDVTACKRIAEEELKVNYRIREYGRVG